MGGSSWNDAFYHDRVSDRAAKGTPTMAYDDAVKTGKAPDKVHDKLSPHGVVRESRDSAAHPASVAIAVFFDVTGSMQDKPLMMQKKLPQLMGLLLRKAYVQDPQILFGAFDDVHSVYDKSLQVGQFESGIEMEDDLTNFLLTGAGGGSHEESSNLALYFLAHRTSIDCFEKRGKKGYAFIISDEKPYDRTSRSELKSVLGVEAQDDVTIEEIVKVASEKYELFYVIPQGTTHWGDKSIIGRWEKLIGAQHIIQLEDPEAICEAIGLAIGLVEGTTDPAKAVDDLKDVGVDPKIAKVAYAALDPLAKSALVKVGTGGALPEVRDRSTAVERI